MITDKDLDFETNDDGDMIDENGEPVFCDTDCCEATAQHRVVVSVEQGHDETRNFCCTCHGVYEIGVQHGRFHEALLHGQDPGRDSSQEYPPLPAL